jgi:hypothetical protein
MQQPDPDLGWHHRYSVQWKPTQPKSFYKIHVNENQTYPAPCGVSPASRTSDPWTFASQSRNQARGGIHQQIWVHHNSVISLSDRNRVEITNFSTDHRYASGVIYFQGASFYVLQSLQKKQPSFRRWSVAFFSICLRGERYVTWKLLIKDIY